MSTATKNEHFQQCLQKGLDFEHYVATPLLHDIFPEFVIKNFAKDPTSKYGPRAYRGANMQDVFVLPDFELFEPTKCTRFWVDSKLKQKPISGRLLSRPHDLALTLDTKAHQKYTHTMSVMQGLLYLLFAVEQTGNIYLVEWNPNPETVTFNNQFGNGPVPVYYIADMQFVGKFYPENLHAGFVCINKTAKTNNAPVPEWSKGPACKAVQPLVRIQPGAPI